MANIKKNKIPELLDWSKDWKKYWDRPMKKPEWEKEEVWPIKAKDYADIDPKTAALVLVDIDKEANDQCVTHAYRYGGKIAIDAYNQFYKKLLPNNIRLVNFFREKKIPVIYVQWYWHKHQYPLLKPHEDEIVVYKWQAGAFGSSSLDSVLRKKGIRFPFFTGMDTSFCVESTVRGAFDHFYEAILIEDACASFLNELHQSTLKTVGNRMALVTNTDSVISDYPWESWKGANRVVRPPTRKEG